MLKTGVVAFLVALICGGAWAQSSKLGKVPPVTRLTELRIGESNMDDVRRTLGDPQGKGQARMPDYPGIRTTWSYEYLNVTNRKVGMFLLVVFFERQAYDGYLWFDLRGLTPRKES